MVGGKVAANTTAPTVSALNAIQARRFNAASELYVATGTPQATDQYTQGGRFTTDGALYVHPVETLGVPSDIRYNEGLCFTPDGKLIVTTDSPVQYLGGLPLDQRGFVSMTIGT